MKEDNSKAPVAEYDLERVEWARRIAGLVLLVIVLGLVTTGVTLGMEYIHLAIGLFLVGGLGIIKMLHIILHPENLVHFPKAHSVDQIIAHRGEHLFVGLDPMDRGERRLAIQDALDSLGQLRGSKRSWPAARVIGGLGTLVCLMLAVVATVVVDDPFTTLNPLCQRR